MKEESINLKDALKKESTRFKNRLKKKRRRKMCPDGLYFEPRRMEALTKRAGDGEESLIKYKATQGGPVRDGGGELGPLPKYGLN